MHPAHRVFHGWLRGQKTARVGQVWIRVAGLYELRHEVDREVPAARLKTYRDPFAARELAACTDAGKYRALKSAPNLRRGWRITGLRFDGLVTALECFYPSAIAHWHEQRQGRLEIASYRDCAARQTGMYRITALLGDEQVRRVAACCCRDGECLKRPYWPVDPKLELEIAKPEAEANELPIPCPEPCSLFLSFARKAVRLEQEEPTKDAAFTKSELELIGQVLRGVVDGAFDDFREGDYNDPRHRQRIQYFLRKHERLFPKRTETERGEVED